HPRTNLHQAMTMDQQLTEIPHCRIRPPQPRKTTLQQQLQNVRRVATIGLLLAHITGPNLGRIADPDLMTQLLHQLHEPLTVATTLHSHQARYRQAAVKLFRLAVTVNQFAFPDFAGGRVENRHLLPTGMEITPYNNHEGFS